MSTLNITLSPRVRALFDSGKRDELFNKINHETALFMLGRSTETTNKGQSPLQQGFGPWKSRGNKRTKLYPAYENWYADEKRQAGKKNWHVWSGDLKRDAIDLAKIKTTRSKIMITVNKGASAAYAAVQQWGSPLWREKKVRKYYDLDESDLNGKGNSIAKFYYKRLALFFGKEAKTGTI